MEVFLCLLSSVRIRGGWDIDLCACMHAADDLLHWHLLSGGGRWNNLGTPQQLSGALATNGMDCATSFETIQIMKLMSAGSWVVFGIGLASILTLQLVAVPIVYWNWGWNRSFFAQHLFWPLMTVAFVFCLGAPLFGGRPLARRLLTALLTGILGAALYFGSSLAIFLLYGA